MSPTFTTAEWLELTQYLTIAVATFEEQAKHAEDTQVATTLRYRARQAWRLRESIANSTTEPSKLQPTGAAYRDTLVSERLNLHRS